MSGGRGPPPVRLLAVSLLTGADRDALRAHLRASGIAGDTRTPRENVVRNAEKLAAGDPDKFLGLGPPDAGVEEILAAVARYCGCSADPADREGPGVIDPDRTLDALESVGRRLAAAARRGERVLLATGHPTGLLGMYVRVADALDAAGAKILTPAEDIQAKDLLRMRGRKVRAMDGVSVLSDGADLLHTHDANPMLRVLEVLGSPPGLVLADHGWAGAAIVRGIEVVAFNDVNDPALWLALARGARASVVPVDDNVPPARYRPLTEVLERAIRSS